MPAISVVMVFHQDSPFLRPAIASVLAQSWADFELVLVDNGSGLRAEDLGDIGQDPRLRWVHLPANLGIPGGHNAGVRAATAPWVALMDYDDLSLPNRLARQHAAVQMASGSVAVIAGQAERIDDAGRRWGQREFSLGAVDAARVRDYASYAAAWVTPASLVRREVLTALPYRESFPFAADLDFQARASEQHEVVLLPDTVLHYRWHPRQTTQSRRADIECSRALIQITTARRRAGRPEQVAATAQAWRGLDAAAVWAAAARVSLAEGFPVAAAYQARRSWILERNLGRAWSALRLVRAARGKAATGAERRRVTAMALRGPVKALGLRPIGGVRG